jgi:hypothetical protein
MASKVMARVNREIVKSRYGLFTIQAMIYSIKLRHVNHPSNIWTRSSVKNYHYMFQLWFYLCCEYEQRYNKKHATWEKLANQLSIYPDHIPEIEETPIPLCMPDECKRDDAVTAYRSFYRSHKREFATWKNQVPDWFI